MNYKNIKTPLGTIGDVIANGKWNVYRDNEDKTIFDNGLGMKIYVMDGCSEEDKDEFQEPFQGEDFMGKKFLYHRRKDHMVWLYLPLFDDTVINVPKYNQRSLF